MTVTGGVQEVQAANTAAMTEQVTSSGTLGKDDFLRLLVTQLANQDPSSPMDNEEFIAQMAQFSQLELLQNMNSNLEQSLTWSLLLSQTINNTMATSLLGRTVTASTDTIVLDNSGTGTIRYDLAEAAAEVVVKISASDGTVIRTLTTSGVPSGTNELVWDGLDADGDQMAAGTYSVSINAENSDGNPVTVSSYFTGEVDSVQYIDGQAYLAVGDVLISLSDVRAIAVPEE